MTAPFARSRLLVACFAVLGIPAAAVAQETVLTFERFTQVAKHDPSGPGVEVDTTSAEILVILGDRRLVVREPTREYVYDFDQRRVRIVDAESMTFADWSLFGLVAFNDLELANRLAAKTGSAPVRELEALFSMPSGVKPSPRESVADSSHGNSVDILINGRPFTHAVFSDTPLPPSQTQTFERFLLYNFHLHPAARRAIMRAGKIPRSLFFRMLDGSEETIVSWRLVKATTTPEINDPTRGLVRQDVTDKDFAALANRLRRCRQMSVDTSRARHTSESLAFEAAAAKQGRFLDAALAHLSREMEGCHPISLGSWPAELRERVASDSGFRACLEAVETLDAQHARALLPRLGNIDQKSLEMAPVVDLLAGRTRIASGDLESGIPQVLRGLRASPCAIGAWMDLGQAYLHNYQPVLAWLCFDVAREVAPARCERLEPSARIEADLLKRRPEFFE
jgi:hypothetical protein